MKKIFLYYLKPFYLRMAGGFVIKFTGTLMDLFLPWALAYMIDTVIPANGRREILLWGVFMLVCSVLAVTFNILANRMAARVAGDAIYVIRNDLFEKVMFLPDMQADGLTRPSLISRLTTDTYHVHQMLGRIQRLGVRAPILLTGGIVMTLLLDPVLAGILLGTLPLLTIVVIAVSKRSIPLYARLQESLDRFVRLVREDIAGIRVIKALSREDYERKRFGEINREVTERERRAAITAAITSPAMNILLNLGMVAVIVAGAIRVNAGLSQVGKILAFMSYFTIILNALLSISRMFVAVSKAAASAERIVRVLETEDEREWERAETDRDQGADGETEIPHIAFEGVSFSYNKIGDNLTEVNLLMRFYDVDQGRICLDGKDVRTIKLSDLRKRFGAVFQNDVLFAGDIYENVSLGRGIGKEQVKEALEHARAEEFVEEKGGIWEKLDIRGANLSGGQKQRLLIARALAGEPEILVLDDSSSALDYRTEGELRRELRENFADTTCIVVAQRISSVMGADHILVLEEGREAGYGTHAELMERCEVYREIERSQMGF